MTQEEFRQCFWKQYLLLEKDFLATDEYVTIHSSNYATFSNRYVYLFLNICSEIDSISDAYCRFLKQDPKIKSIIGKLGVVFEKDESLKNCQVKTKYPYEVIYRVPFQKVTFNQDSSRASSTDWWQAYNQVKHFRNEKDENGLPNIRLANLKNVLDAIGGLYILSKSLYNQLNSDDIRLEDSSLFV